MLKVIFFATETTAYVDGFGTGIFEIDLQLPSKKIKKMMIENGFKKFMIALLLIKYICKFMCVVSI